MTFQRQHHPFSYLACAPFNPPPTVQGDTYGN